MDTVIIPVTKFLRSARPYLDSLSRVDKILLTRESRLFAELRATPEEKNQQLLKLVGTWDGGLFANNKVWRAVAVRRNRKTPINI